MSNLFIPSKIRVGFQKRDDTFTGKLAYIIYYDAKGEIKQFKSWDGWRDHDIDYVEFENTPRSGYIFNKGVQRDGHWGSGRSVIRVYDPRDFEFEIDVDNLIGILMHSDVSKRDIVEECVFAWSGNHVILLPVNSEDYQNGMVHTAKQSKTITNEDLTPGHSYSHKSETNTYTYIGYYDYFEPQNWKNSVARKGKNHVFYDGKNFVAVKVEKLAECISDDISQDFSNLVEKFSNSANGKDPGRFTYGVPQKGRDYFFKLNSYSSYYNLFKVFLNVQNGFVNVENLHYEVWHEKGKTLEKITNGDHWTKQHAERFAIEERKSIIESCKAANLDHNKISVNDFMTIVKKLGYTTAYYVDPNKNKTEL